MRRTSLLGAVCSVAILSLALTSSALAETGPASATSGASDIKDITLTLNQTTLPVVTGSIDASVGSTRTLRSLPAYGGKAVKAPARAKARKGKTARRAGRALLAHTPQVGELRSWLALDNERGVYYRKQFQLRAIGHHIEVWVAEGFQGTRLANCAPGQPAPPTGCDPSDDTEYLPGDCRNNRAQITDAQAQYLVREFDLNIYPKESAAFSTPPDRDGSNALAALRTSPLYHPGGEGDNIVVLIDNVRDDNFYDYNNTQGLTRIAGFFSSQLNELFDRNIMTIDSFDWLHLTGANPPNDPVPGDFCRSASARPFLYEGVFAHEYQHLLEYYEDPEEASWVNEGLSDYAEVLTGYLSPSAPITDIRFDSHTQCFLGYLRVLSPANPNPRATGGPENSLTLWGDQGEDEILCDYGAALTFMLYLEGQFGLDFMSRLHREDAEGLGGLSSVVGRQGIEAMELVRRWAAAVALDAALDRGVVLQGEGQGLYGIPSANASINWDNPEAYSTPGAPPNGSDYVRLRNASGAYLRADQIDSLEFRGSRFLTPREVEWTVDGSPPLHPGDPALYSGTGDNLDRAIVRQVTVPAGSPTVTFESLWNAEAGWDFGFVQVSTDDGRTYQSIPCTDTTSVTDPGAIAIIKANVPGFTGFSGGWRNETCSLASYAGQTIQLAFRYVTDPSVEGDDPDVPAGWWIDDIAVAGTLLSDGSTLAGWQTPSQIRPVRVGALTIQLISYPSTGSGVATIDRIRLSENLTWVCGSGRGNEDDDEDGGEGGDCLSRLRATGNDVVAAIITFEDPTESIGDYAPYELIVNGVLQPGGS